MDAARTLPRRVAGTELYPLSHLAERTASERETRWAPQFMGLFFATLFVRKLFGGALYDQNGYPPFRSPVGPWLWDANVTAFSVLSTILAVGILVVGGALYTAAQQFPGAPTCIGI